MIVLVNNSEERDIVINYLNIKKDLEFQPENMPKEACFVIETERGIVVTDKPQYIAYHQGKTGDSITTFTKFVKQIMLGHISKLTAKTKILKSAVNTYRGVAKRQNEQVKIFQEIFKL
jgi:23S rRNA-/tRNA-specific pseudouridylate synthase